MHHVRQENLPFVGSSHEFVGAQQGDTGVSVFLFHGEPGSGPGPHRHPYDEIQFDPRRPRNLDRRRQNLRAATGPQAASSSSKPAKSTASKPPATPL